MIRKNDYDDDEDNVCPSANVPIVRGKNCEAKRFSLNKLYQQNHHDDDYDDDGISSNKPYQQNHNEKDNDEMLSKIILI